MGLLDRIQRQGGTTPPVEGTPAVDPTAPPSAVAGGTSGWMPRPEAPPGASLGQPTVVPVPAPGVCVAAGCAAVLVVPCSYQDRRGEHCPTTSCAEHRREVESRPYCRRHAGTADTLRLAALHGQQIEAPDLNDRSLSLLRWVAHDLAGSVADILARCSAGRFTVLDDAAPIHVRADRTRGRPAAWEQLWTLADPAGPVLRVVLRVEASRPETVILVADHAVLAALVPPWVRHPVQGEAEPTSERDEGERAAFRAQMLAALEAHLEAHPPGGGPDPDYLR